MEILVLYNVARELKKGKPSDMDSEKEIEIVVPLVKDILQERGHGVRTMKASYNLWENLKKVRPRTDLVFNLAESFGGTNINETVVPAMLEALEMPFTGASAHNMHLTLDKEKTKLVAASYGIPVPPYQLFRDADQSLKPNLEYPLIVKPVREEASIGVYSDNVVTSDEGLQLKVRETLELYHHLH